VTEQEFMSRMAEAQTVCATANRLAYYEGYVRGFTRFFRGPKFGSLQEHEQWLAFFTDWDLTKVDCGRGYRDGLQGIIPRL
jgi:hypothetical protein